MSNGRILLVAILVALSSTACATAPAASGPQPAQARTTVQVANHNWSDMVVYAVRNGLRVRLGTVTSMTSRRLTIPRSLSLATGNFHLAADPIGSRENFMTQPIPVAPGAEVEFVIENQLSISSYSIRDR